MKPLFRFTAFAIAAVAILLTSFKFPALVWGVISIIGLAASGFVLMDTWDDIVNK